MLRRADHGLERLRKDHGDDAYHEIPPRPMPNNCEAPGTHTGSTPYRSRWRILYRVLSGKRKVLIARVEPRPEVYSGYDRW